GGKSGYGSHNQPSRMIGKLYSYPCGVLGCGATERDVETGRAMHSDGMRGKHKLLVGKHGQVVLLTIAERVTADTHPADEQRILVRRLIAEIYLG
ncbi:hypothetical protein RCJ22_08430, partial [Vibrio sp. FNV 38]|nr:hypothetical protein [Vibrio sp. FNV 38]